MIHIHNEIHRVLLESAEKHGWNEESQMIHLMGFINSLDKNADITTDFDVYWQFSFYLQQICESIDQAAQDNDSMVEATTDRRIQSEMT